MNSEVSVIFQKKSIWQKPDCINRHCTKISTLQAVTKKAAVRCCEEEACKKIALEMAQAIESDRAAV